MVFMTTTVFKKMSLLTLGLACAAGVIFAVGAKTDQTQIDANASTAQTERRVYVYLAGAWDGSDMYIHYWGGVSGTDWNACPAMTKVVSDYYQGLFYYDISMDTTTFLVKSATGNVSKTSNQSQNISVTSLFVGSNYYVAAVAAWVDDGIARAVSFSDTLPMSSLQCAAVLNNINSCDSSYAEGYNAWPQLNDLFILPSTLDGSTVVTDNYGDSTTISAKCAYLQNRYTVDQAS